MTTMFHWASLALLTIGSFAVHIPDHKNLEKFVEKNNKGGTKWVVLVAGSNGWDNYRHQADICHAYQIVIRNGIPEDNIITMMYDDIAYHPKNPTPGVIINRPNGTDVYKGVKIDYKGEDVTKSNFLRVITGDADSMLYNGTGKVINGGPLDHIFIYFANEGDTEVLSFPSENLYGDELYDAFNFAFRYAKYKKMLVYVEANYAGSMFEWLYIDNKNILAITASSPRERSSACYCSENEYDTCLGDEFSVSWMENIEAETSKFTARERNVYSNFDQVRNAVKKSNVMLYGDFSVGFEKLSSFIGDVDDYVSATRSLPKKTINTKGMSSRDVPVKTMEYKLASKDFTSEMKQDLPKTLRKNYQMRSIIDNLFQAIYSKVVKARPDIKKEIGYLDKSKRHRLTLDMFPCYRNILNKISESCFALPKNPYTLQKLSIFANLCVLDKQIHQTVEDLIKESCSNIPENIFDVI